MTPSGRSTVAGRQRATLTAAAVVVTALLVVSCGSGPTPGAPGGSVAAPAPDGTAALSAPPADPSVRGPHAVGYADIEVADPARDRTLPVSVWYPAASAGGDRATYRVVGSFGIPARDVWAGAPMAPGRHPLVVFSHGSGGTRLQSWFLTEVLASHGFVVVAPDHVGNTLTDRTDVPALARSAADRPKDVRVLLDDVLARAARPAAADNLLGGAVDPEHIGMAGHSYGGYTTLVAAGGSAYGDPPDPRIKAIAPLAPAASIIPEDHLRAVGVPILLMGGTRDTTTPPDSQVLRTYDLVSSPVRFRAVLTDANHNSFSIACGAREFLDDPAFPAELRDVATRYLSGQCGPEVMPFATSASIIDRYVGAFFLWQLAGDERYRRFLTPVEGVTFAGTDG